MADPLPKEYVSALKKFIDTLKGNPELLHHSQLQFFKDYIESFGSKIPAPQKNSTGTEQPQKPNAPPAAEKPEEDELFESDIELDMEGVIPPDEDEPQKMGPEDVVNVTEDDMDASNEKKSQAVGFYAEGEYNKAVDAYTEAILLNPRAAMLYAKRGQVFLALKKPNACVRDCDVAVKLNPDCAAAYKFRGRARRLLGDFLQAAADLRSACKLDFDEQADEWLKEVTPNARKIEEHNRKYERLRAEQQVRAARERAQKVREARSKASANAQQEPAPSPGPGEKSIPSELLDLLNEPEFINGMKDPEIAAAFEDIQRNPGNILKHQSNPKVAAFMMKVASKLGGGAAGGLGGMMGGLGGMMGGLGGMFGGGGGSDAAPTGGAAAPGPAAPADIDVD